MKKETTSLTFRGLLVSALLAAGVTAFAQVHLVADLKSGGPPEGQRFFQMHKSGEARSFLVVDFAELWTSDGTTAGTKALKRFNRISELQVVDGVAFFSAQTNNEGVELWRSNGTAAGTMMVKDIYPGRGDSNPSDLTVAGSILYFSANNAINGRELWKSDGTAAGTTLVKDIFSGNEGSGPDDLAAVGNRVFFKAGAPDVGYELWVSQGTEASTVMVGDLNPGPLSSAPGKIVAVGDNAYFIASAPGMNSQLWKSNGTAAGTSIVKVLRGGNNPFIDYMVEVNGMLFFNSFDDTYGNELWRSDGTAAGTYMVKDFTPGGSSFDGWFEQLESIGGKLFFTYQSTYPYYNLAMSDGTAEGTKQITFFPGDPLVQVPGYPSLSEINGEAYFLGTGKNGKGNLYKSDLSGNVTKIEDAVTPFSATRTEIRKMGSLYYFPADNSYWRSDGTSTGTWRLRSMGYAAGSYPVNLTDVGGTLYFNTEGTNEIWKTNGTSGTTVKIADADTVIEAGGGGGLFFVSGSVNGSSENSVWRSDGTPGGTIQLADLLYPAKGFKWFNNKMYFIGTTEDHGAELWESDGTIEGTQLFTDNIYPGPGGASPLGVTVAGSKMYFSATQPESGFELWTTDGSSAGTLRVADIAPGEQSSSPASITPFSGKVYFFAFHPSYGRELWESSGTAASTFLVKDIRGGDTDAFEPQADLGAMRATPNLLFFTAVNADNRFSIWKSDGTSAGTMQVKAFDQIIYLPRLIATIGNDVFFTTQPTFFSFELWKTNGSSITRLATFSNQEFNPANSVAVKNNILYFTSDDQVHVGKSLYRSDGTVAGTYEINFLGQPEFLKTSGPHVYLTGNTQKEGHELFTIDEATTVSMSEASVAQSGVLEEEHLLSSYPSPFGNSMVVRVAGGEGETFSLRVINSAGQDVEATRHDCNVDYLVGKEWPTGIYVLQVRKGNAVVSRRVVKSFVER